MPLPPLAVTGATGQIGGRVARRLAAAGGAQRLVVRDPARAPDLPGAAVAQASYGDSPALRRALAGVTTLFLVSASESADRVDLHRSAVDDAVAGGVERVVYLSFYGATRSATFTLARDHAATEEHIRAAPLRWTFLRDNLYADFLPLLVGADGVLRGPAGDGRVAAVAQDDVAEVAAQVLLAPAPHEGRTHDLTGPAALSFPEIAAALTAAAGRPIRYHPESVEEAYASRASYGAPDWQVDAWVSTYTAVAAGELAGVSDAVERVTGHPPISFRELLERDPTVLRSPTV